MIILMWFNLWVMPRAFLEPAQGSASLNIFKLTNENLSLELNSSIRKAKKSKEPVSVLNIKVKKESEVKEIDLDVIPVKLPENSKENYFLILFKEKSDEKDGKKRRIKNKKNVTILNDDKQLDEIKKELLITREHLQSIIEEREGTNEDLRSTLEELQSSNEELQSTNEELETAKEELQSTNEELITVNEELENRNTALTDLNNDYVNLLANIKIPIVMLDRDLRIRRFTPKAEKLWSLISTDIGRSLSDINPKINVPNLRNYILEIIENLKTKEFDVKDDEGNWYSMRIKPYKTIDNKIDGVVISLVDIDLLKKDHISITKALNISDIIVSFINKPFLILNNKLKIKSASYAFYSLFQLEKSSVSDLNIYDVGSGQ